MPQYQAPENIEKCYTQGIRPYALCVSATAAQRASSPTHGEIGTMGFVDDDGRVQVFGKNRSHMVPVALAAGARNCIGISTRARARTECPSIELRLAR